MSPHTVSRSFGICNGEIVVLHVIFFIAVGKLAKQLREWIDVVFVFIAVLVAVRVIAVEVLAVLDVAVLDFTVLDVAAFDSACSQVALSDWRRDCRVSHLRRLYRGRIKVCLCMSLSSGIDLFNSRTLSIVVLETTALILGLSAIICIHLGAHFFAHFAHHCGPPLSGGVT